MEQGAGLSLSYKRFDWRIGYGVFCLVYAAWAVYLGLDNFDMVHGEYRRALVRQQPAQVEKIALHELADQCRKKIKRQGRYRVTGDRSSGISDGACLSFPAAVLAEQQKTVTEHLLVEKKRFKRKLVVFYVIFGVFFLALPLFFLYLLLSFFIWLFKNLKFVKNP